MLQGNPYPEMPNIMISQEGVLKLLKKINPHKASGQGYMKDLALYNWNPGCCD